MFTGIIQYPGEVAAIDTNGDWTITIKTLMPMGDVALGASIACNGMCVTVTHKTEDRFSVRCSSETLSKTTTKHWRVGTRLNLERALRVGDELGGHIVSGHIDGVAHVIDRQPAADSLLLQFELPESFSRFLAPKGSIVIDGVSLTVNTVEANRFTVMIIPHTQSMTTLGDLVQGDIVNFEVDTIARYLDQLLQQRTAA